VGAGDFSADQILANWNDILAAGIDPSSVHLIGIGGGALAAVEYRMALAMGAQVGVMSIPKEFGESSDAVDRILTDPQWKGFKNLLPLPRDPATLHAFLAPGKNAIPRDQIEQMAEQVHVNYRKGKEHEIQPDSLKLGPHLPEDRKVANRAQAAYAIEILKAAGFQVREAGNPVLFTGLTKKEIEFMAELEHGRWNVERLRQGWRPGKRDDEKRTHDCLVPWADLPEHKKEWDCDAVKGFPAILAKANIEVSRP
jgi:hypothetical protein